MSREDRRKRRALRRIRREIGLLGFPLDDLTDEQIENGVIEFGRIASRIGIRIREYQEAMQKVTAILNTRSEQTDLFIQNMRRLAR